MNEMRLCFATFMRPMWEEATITWDQQASKQWPIGCAQKMDVMDAYQKLFRESPEPILAYIHDDVLCNELGWDLRVLREFQDPEVGVVGFAGALGHGDPEMYQKPYELQQLGRRTFLSNMRDAEHHGQRFDGVHDVAVLDGFALIVRRKLLDDAWGWPLNTPIGYIGYDYWLCCMARRLGYRIRMVGIACTHLSGGSNGLNPHTKIDFEGAHRYIYVKFRDVLPFTVPA